MSEKKYYKLYKEIKSKILNGEYKANEKLPSKRVMADKSGCSTITVEAAYRSLIDEGYITSKERSGFFVNDIEGLFDASNVLPSYKIELLKDEEQRSAGHDFEYSVWFKTIRKVIADNGERLFVKSPNEGCAVLRNAIAKYLLRYRGMYAQPERIIIGSGSEQLYETVVRILGADKKYGIEYPSYSQIETVYNDCGANILKLEMGDDGIKSDALQKSDIDILHVTPFHSYPTGVTATVSKRYEYLKWAQKGERYIVEDDFDSEFFMPGHPIESLYFLDKNDSVIYMNTFSKSLSPSMRMGYMILPESLLERYNEKMKLYSCTVPVLDQYVLAEFISSGSFERHLNRMRHRQKVTR
ncbi:MAG: PLP-dependent aminotransferase family protein [Clostridia bacterium]|nr:PLP-dependent aminotransferase family protein [Clostridia bacterium]